MPSKSTTERARRDLRAGKRPTTAAGEFVHEEIEHVRRGKHGARSTRQAIAIGLSKARRAGVPLPPPKKGRVRAKTRRSAQRDHEAGRELSQGRRKPRAASPGRRRASGPAVKREGRGAASHAALSAHAKRSAANRRHARSRSHASAS